MGIILETTWNKYGNSHLEAFYTQNFVILRNFQEICQFRPGLLVMKSVFHHSNEIKSIWALIANRTFAEILEKILIYHFQFFLRKLKSRIVPWFETDVDRQRCPCPVLVSFLSGSFSPDSWKNCSLSVCLAGKGRDRGRRRLTWREAKIHVLYHMFIKVIVSESKHEHFAFEFKLSYLWFGIT